MLSFHIFIAMIAGATALQRPNHLAFPLFFLLLLALLSGMVVASLSAFADVELLRHRILGLRHEVSDLTSLNGLVGSEASDMGSSHPATKTPGTSSPRNDFATQHPHPLRKPSKGSEYAPGPIYVRGRGDAGRAIQG
jgi:hypothetical protein